MKRGAAITLRRASRTSTMAKDFSRKFYLSKAWQECRASFIASRQIIDGGLCERCKERLGEEVHHTIKLTPENINDADITLNHARLKFLN